MRDNSCTQSHFLPGVRRLLPIGVTLAIAFWSLVPFGCDKSAEESLHAPQISPTFQVAAVDTFCGPGQGCIKFYARTDMDVLLKRVVITSPAGSSLPYDLGNALLPRDGQLELQPGSLGGTWTFEFIGYLSADTAAFDVTIGITVEPPEVPPAFTLSWSDTAHGTLVFYIQSDVDVRLSKILIQSPNQHLTVDSLGLVLLSKGRRIRVGPLPRQSGEWQFEMMGMKVQNNKPFDALDTLLVPPQLPGPTFHILVLNGSCGEYTECIRFQARADSSLLLSKVEITSPAGTLFTYYAGDIIIYQNQLFDLQQTGSSFLKVLGFWKFEFYGRLATGSKSPFDKIDSVQVFKIPPVAGLPAFTVSYDSTVCGAGQRCVQFHAAPDMDVYVQDVTITNPNSAVDVYHAGYILVSKGQEFPLQQSTYSYRRFGGLWRFKFSGNKASGDNAPYSVTDSLFVSP